jgi:hypothetical protein
MQIQQKKNWKISLQFKNRLHTTHKVILKSNLTLRLITLSKALFNIKREKRRIIHNISQLNSEYQENHKKMSMKG